MTDQTPNNDWPPAQGQTPADPDGAPQTPQPNPVPPTQPDNQQPQQYGQRPDSYDAGPGGPGGPMDPGGPAGPDGPVPPKKGLPGWAIGLIIAGGLLLIGIIVAMVVVVSLIVNSAQEGQPLPPTASEEPPAATETEEPPADTETEPGDSGDSGDSGATSDTISINDSADFDAPPIWAAPFLSGWDIVILDQDGINQFENSALDCGLTTSQNAAPVDTSSSGDSVLTMQLMDELRDQLASATMNAEVVSESSIDLSVGAAGSGSSIEFAMNRINYSTDTGDYASTLFGRSMPHSGSYMWTQLSCERTVLDGPDSPLQAVIDQIAVVPAF